MDKEGVIYMHNGILLSHKKEWDNAVCSDMDEAAAAAAAKSLQSCSPPGSPVPGILQARILECVAISFSNAWKWKVKGKSLSCVRL